MASKKITPKFGVFYRSQGRWTGPYRGITHAFRTWQRRTIQEDLAFLKNNILKSRIQLRQTFPVVLG